MNSHISNSCSYSYVASDWLLTTSTVVVFAYITLRDAHLVN